MDFVPQSPAGGVEKAPLSSHTLLRVGLFIVALIVVVAVLAGAYAGFTNFAPSTEQSAQPLAGLLLLSLAAKSPESSQARIFPTGYDFAQKGLIYMPLDKLTASPAGVNIAYQHVFSSNGNFVAFLGAPNIGGEPSFSDIPLDVYRTSVSQSASYDDFVARMQQAERITATTGNLKQQPSISNAGDVVYISHRSGPPAILFASEANTWDIYLVPQNGDERLVTQGISPKWVSDDRFVFLKNDGLYMYSVSGGREERIWGMQGAATMHMALDVSDDGQYVAWAAPDVGTVSIFRVLNWNTGTLVLRGTIQMPGFRVALSPDSRFVAVEVVIPGDVAGEMKIAINYYDIDTLQMAAQPLVLAGVDSNQTYLTDWRP